MKSTTRAVLAAAALLAGSQAFAQATFFAREGFRGESFTLDGRDWNFARDGFNDRASSVEIRGGAWEVCEHARFEGRCVILRPGGYPSLRQIGLDNQISSARPVEHAGRWHDRAPQPVYVPAQPVYTQPQPVYVQPAPAIFDVPVTSVQAIASPPQQRCWTERQAVNQPRSSDPNVPGALIGGVVGGVLGHQVGKGTGRDLATIGGAVAGAALGANVDRGGVAIGEREVQRCETVQGQPTRYDVGYVWQGVERRVQLATPPGRTIRINAQGQPLL